MSRILIAVTAVWNQITHVMLSIRVLDVVDILIIAWLIYKALVFLRETRAGQLAKGIIFLVLLYLFAKLAKLAVLDWVLSSIVDSALIAVAIIFQPEIRRILERMGQTRLSSSRLFDSDTQNIYSGIDNIAKAAGQMQDDKIGALIVFEKKTQLGEIINTGTVIDAEPTVPLIKNVFFPKSPLHDGAVIVRNGRIYAAGCILPLTASENISSDLGTRHRAAIGMSENSDAMVLVVSEETGAISIACNGQIKRNLNSVMAGIELKKYLVDSDVEKKDSVIVNAIKRLNPFSGIKNKNKEEESNEDEKV